MSDIKLNRIDATLKYGQFFTSGWLVFFYSLIAFCAIMPVSSIVYLILVFLGIEIPDSETTLSLTCSNIVCCATILGVIYVLYRNCKLKKKILIWLEDAIELTAETTTLDRFRTFGHPIAETKLQVEFYYCGVLKIQSSYDDAKEDHWYKRNGFFKILSKYADRTIKILYSPKYDEILILKNT